jgi:hypothetical protein
MFREQNIALYSGFLRFIARKFTEPYYVLVNFLSLLAKIFFQPYCVYRRLFIGLSSIAHRPMGYNPNYLPQADKKSPLPLVGDAEFNLINF